MFDRFRYKMAQFMQGRYGMDRFGQFLSTVVLILVILDLFLRWAPLWWICLALIIYLYYRMFSRNIAKRYAENQRYLAFTSKLRSSGFGRSFTGFFRNIGSRIRGAGASAKQAKRESDAGFRIYRCPQCGQKIRVPKGKGHIMIRCPKCGNQFEKRT